MNTKEIGLHQNARRNRKLVFCASSAIGPTCSPLTIAQGRFALELEFVKCNSSSSSQRLHRNERGAVCASLTTTGRDKGWPRPFSH